MANGLVRLTATTLGSHTPNVTLAFDTGHGDVAHYAANVVAPTFEVVTTDAVPSDGRLDFGTWRIDAPPVDRTFTIINDTGNTRVLGGCLGPGGQAPQFALVSACPGSIPAHGQAEFTVRLTPAAVGTLQEGIGVPLGVDASIMVQLDARIVDHQLALSASQLAFPDRLRGETVQRTVTITNLASNSITVPVAVTGAAFTLVGPETVALAGGGSGDVTVEFRPATPGSYAGTLELGAAGDLDRVVIPLAGIAGAPMVTSDAALEFGDVALGSTREATFTLHNLDATRAFRIDQLVIDDAEFAVALPVDPMLGSGATLTIPVQFTPATAGAHTSQLSVFLEGDATPVAIVDLAGQGLAHGGGGCNAGGSPALAVALAVLALGRRRRRGAEVRMSDGREVDHAQQARMSLPVICQPALSATSIGAEYTQAVLCVGTEFGSYPPKYKVLGSNGETAMVRVETSGGIACSVGSEIWRS